RFASAREAASELATALGEPTAPSVVMPVAKPAEARDAPSHDSGSNALTVDARARARAGNAGEASGNARTTLASQAPAARFHRLWRWVVGAAVASTLAIGLSGRGAPPPPRPAPA